MNYTKILSGRVMAACALLVAVLAFAVAAMRPAAPQPQSVTLSASATGSAIYGCVYLNGNRTLERVYLTGTNHPCPAGTLGTHWNITGPVGPKGATGAKGVEGPKGESGPTTAGPSGLNVQVVTVAGQPIGYCPISAPYLLGITPLASGNTHAYSISEPAPGQRQAQVTDSVVANAPLEVTMICAK